MNRLSHPLRLAVSLLLAASIVSLPVLAGLSAGDSLISRSYVEKTLKPQLENLAKTRIEAGFSTDNPLLNDLQKRLDNYKLRLSDSGLANSMAEAAKNAVASTYAFSARTRVVLSKGDILSGKLGSGYTLLSGGVTLGGSGTVINTAAGTEQASGKLAANVRYIQSEKAASTLTATADSTVLLVSGYYSVKKATAHQPENMDMAFALRQMHLISGTPDGFKLGSTLTRGEGIIFMLNFLGKTKTAAKYTGSMPFKDIPDWLRPYAAYAYNEKLIAGTSATTYKPNDPMTYFEFITLLLRCLGYSDTGGKDFVYNKSLEKAIELGIFKTSEKSYLAIPRFMRDRAVYVCYYVLDAKRADGKLMSDHLISTGVMTEAELTNARKNITRTR